MTHPHLEGLMPCPFCGGAAEFKHDTVSRTCWVACSRMDCAGEWCNEKDAAEFWNTRALAALPGGGVDASPLMPTLAVLKETNPVVRACFDMYRHASMLALLIAEMDRRHDRIEKLALDTLNMRPGPFFIPTPNPHEADQ